MKSESGNFGDHLKYLYIYISSTLYSHSYPQIQFLIMFRPLQQIKLVPLGVSMTLVFSFPVKTLSDDSLDTSIQTCQSISNWSATHFSNPTKIYEPKSPLGVLHILTKVSNEKGKLRPIGTALSPNGIGFNGAHGNLISLHELDYVKIDKKKMQVVVGAGARVNQILVSTLQDVDVNFTH